VTRRLVAALLLVLTPATVGALDEETRTIPTRPGVTESFVLIHPSGTPVASVVLFMESRGALGLQRGPLGSRNTNFLVRTRQRFAERGLLVAVVDVPSDRTSQALVGFRTGAEHAADVKALIAALTRRGRRSRLARRHQHGQRVRGERGRLAHRRRPRGCRADVQRHAAKS
jgi:hypothetical protein